MILSIGWLKKVNAVICIFIVAFANRGAFAQDHFRGIYFGVGQLRVGNADEHVHVLSQSGFSHLLIKLPPALTNKVVGTLDKYVLAAQERDLTVYLVVNIADTVSFCCPDERTGHESRPECFLTEAYFSGLRERLSTAAQYGNDRRGVAGVLMDVEWYGRYPGRCIFTAQLRKKDSAPKGVEEAWRRTIATVILDGWAALEWGVLGYTQYWFADNVLLALDAAVSTPLVFLEQSYTFGVNQDFLLLSEEIKKENSRRRIIPGFWIQEFAPNELVRQLASADARFGGGWLFSAVSLINPEEQLMGPYRIGVPQKRYLDVLRFRLSDKRRDLHGSVPRSLELASGPGLPPNRRDWAGKCQTRISRARLAQVAAAIDQPDQLLGLRGFNTIVWNAKSVSHRIDVEAKRVGKFRRNGLAVFSGQARLADVPLGTRMTYLAEVGNPLHINAEASQANVYLGGETMLLGILARQDCPAWLINPSQEFVVVPDSQSAVVSISFRVDLPNEDANVVAIRSGWVVDESLGDRGKRTVTFSRANSNDDRYLRVRFVRSRRARGFEDVKDIWVEGALPILFPVRGVN